MKLKILKDFETSEGNQMRKGNIIEVPTGDSRILHWMAMHWVEAAGEDTEVT